MTLRSLCVRAILILALGGCNAVAAPDLVHVTIQEPICADPLNNCEIRTLDYDPGSGHMTVAFEGMTEGFSMERSTIEPIPIAELTQVLAQHGADSDVKARNVGVGLAMRGGATITGSFPFHYYMGEPTALRHVQEWYAHLLTRLDYASNDWRNALRTAVHRRDIRSIEFSHCYFGGPMCAGGGSYTFEVDARGNARIDLRTWRPRQHVTARAVIDPSSLVPILELAPALDARYPPGGMGDPGTRVAFVTNDRTFTSEAGRGSAIFVDVTSRLDQVVRDAHWTPKLNFARPVP